MSMTYGEKMALKTSVSREEAERVLAKDGIGCGAVMALRFAHTLLATMTELEQVKGGLHITEKLLLSEAETTLELRAANAAMTERVWRDAAQEARECDYPWVCPTNQQADACDQMSERIANWLDRKAEAVPQVRDRTSG